MKWLIKQIVECSRNSQNTGIRPWHGLCLKKRKEFPWGISISGFLVPQRALNIRHDAQLEDTMKTWKWALLCLGVASVLVIVPSGLREARAESAARQHRLPGGVYVDLTKEFYEALQGTTEGKEKVYSNSMSDEYLRQLAVSSTFTVRTNLQIIRQQERIIQLLQSIVNKEK